MTSNGTEVSAAKVSRECRTAFRETVEAVRQGQEDRQQQDRSEDTRFHVVPLPLFAEVFLCEFLSDPVAEGPVPEL